MSQTDKAFIKAFRHGPSTPRPVRRPVAAPVEERPVAAVAAASSEPHASAAAAQAPTVRAAEPAPTASSLPPVSQSVDEGPESDRHLPVIERDEDERPGEPILSFEEARLLRGDAPLAEQSGTEAPSTVTSVAPSAKPEVRSAPSAAPTSLAPPVVKPLVKPVAESKERPLPAEPKESKAASSATLDSAAAPVLQVPKPTLASAKPTAAEAPSPPRAVRGLHLRTLADFTEEASAEEPWAIRRKVESFEMPGVCQSLLAARGEDFHRLAQELHARREKGLKTLWVGSCQGNEGATSFAVCLAHVLGKQGVHTALVDHDLTNPGVADMLHLNPEVGWREVLTGEAVLPDALWESADGWSVLPLRPDNAAPLSGSQLLRLRLSMALLRRQFDLVLLDAGPFRLVGDEEMTYPQPDAAILVYDPQATTSEELGKQADRLVARQIDLLGAVENFSLHESEGKVA